MNASSDRQAVLRLAIDHGVTARDDTARLGDLLDRALEDALELRKWRVLGPGRDVESEEHLPAHRVDVRHRVGRTDRAGCIGVVDDRREEVERFDDRDVARDQVDRGVVGRVETDEQLRGSLLRAHRTQHLRQRAGAQLGPSASAGGERRQADFIAREQNRPMVLTAGGAAYGSSCTRRLLQAR